MYELFLFCASIHLPMSPASPAKEGQSAEKKPVPTSGTKQNEQEKGIAQIDLMRLLISTYGGDEEPPNESQKKFSDLLTAYLKQEISKYKCAATYNILIHFDNSAIIKSDSDAIYGAVSNFEEKGKPLLMLLVSVGGDAGSAYLIGKLCAEFCNKKFVVVVPRYAKSAATLLSCAANEIHMGNLSELGPIDPQIKGMPTLGLKHSIEHIAELAGKIPGSSKMFAEFLKGTIEPIQIGYYERVAESATQYAERLLVKHEKTLINTPGDIANRLVYSYKDHKFVIDKEEATAIFGGQTIFSNTPEYELGNRVYSILSEVENLANIFNYLFYFIGATNAGGTFRKRPNR